MKFKLLLILLIGTLALTLAMIEKRPLTTAYCTQCVMRREAEEWRIGSQWVVRENATLSSTPVSELLAAKHVTTPHEHQWVSRQLAKEAVDQTGAPLVESLEFLNTPRVVNFLRCVFDYADRDSQARWRELALTLDYTPVMEASLRFCRFPEEGFSDARAFMTWWTPTAFPLFNRMRETTELD